MPLRELPLKKPTKEKDENNYYLNYQRQALLKEM